MSINRVIVSGNLTRDPELRRTQSGTAVLGFGLAVNDRRKNAQTGQWEDYANFVDCTLFGNRAESLAGILRKGLKVTVEGKLHWSQWERNGEKRSKLEVFADEVDLPPRGAAGPQDQYQAHGYAQQPQTPPQTAPQGGYAPQVDGTQGVYDQDIPF